VPETRSRLSDQGFRGRACRLVFRILYHLIAALARLAMRSGRAKDLEIVLRHQLAVLGRNVDRPAVTDDDRSLLATVASALPRPVGARKSVVAGQARFQYSLMRPSHQVDLMTRGGIFRTA
jgi:hypothetical protein